MKQIPNIFTLLNLVFGCIAIMYIMQPGLVPQYIAGNEGYTPYLNEETGVQFVNIPEQIQLACLFIGLAAVVDFIDGFVARLFKAASEMGKQLDSLADVVSFGVAPGMIIFQFLRLSYAQQPDGLDTGIIWLLPAFIMPAAGAYRLARFNIDTQQSYGFKGVPIPAAGLLIASFPMIGYFDTTSFVHLLINKWFWYAVILIVSYLMVSTLPMIAMKFRNLSIKDNWPIFLLVIIAIIAAIVLKWLAVPVVFVVYVILSLLIKQKQHDV